jgi:hypothetical protein
MHGRLVTFSARDLRERRQAGFNDGREIKVRGKHGLPYK